MLIFVYGTLLEGERNHPQIADARFVGEARTEPRYELADLGGYPALLEDGDSAIRGEIYDVDPALLTRLDAFEDVPTLYERKPIALIGGCADGYVMPRARAKHAPRIAEGDWRVVVRRSRS